MSKCCIACLVVLVILLLAVGIAFAFLWNSTPESLNIADKKINDTSCIDLGIEKYKIKDIVKGIKQIKDFDPSSVLSNGYNTVTEAHNSLEALDGSNVKTGAELNPSMLLISEASYSKPYLKKYQDTTLAFLFNSALTSSASVEKNYYGNLNVSVSEVSIIKNDSETSAKIVLKIPFAENGNLKNFPDYVLLTVFAKFDVSVYGKANVIDTSIKVSDGNELMTAIISKSLDKYIDNGLDEIKDTTSDLFFKMINNLGCIASLGSATMGTDGSITGDPAYGSSGVENGKITFAVYYK